MKVALVIDILVNPPFIFGNSEYILSITSVIFLASLSDTSQKQSDVVTVTIEGELP